MPEDFNFFDLKVGDTYGFRSPSIKTVRTVLFIKDFEAYRAICSLGGGGVTTYNYIRELDRDYNRLRIF